MAEIRSQADGEARELPAENQTHADRQEQKAVLRLLVELASKATFTWQERPQKSTGERFAVAFDEWDDAVSKGTLALDSRLRAPSEQIRALWPYKRGRRVEEPAPEHLLKLMRLYMSSPKTMTLQQQRTVADGALRRFAALRRAALRMAEREIERGLAHGIFTEGQADKARANLESWRRSGRPRKSPGCVQ